MQILEQEVERTRTDKETGPKLPPVLELRSRTTPVLPFRIDGLCHRISTDAFAGPVLETVAGSYMDLQLTLPKSATTDEMAVIETIHSCAVQCVKLENRGAVIGYPLMKQRIAAVVEHCFLERLPCLPKPLGQRKEATILQEAPTKDENGNPAAGMAPGTRVTILSRKGAETIVETENQQRRLVPSRLVGDDPKECVFRRLWTVEANASALQTRYLGDLQIIAKHYAFACLCGNLGNRPGRHAHCAVTAGAIYCCLDAGIRAFSPNRLFMADILRGEVFMTKESDESVQGMPCGLATTSLIGASFGQLTNSLITENWSTARCRREVILYIDSVERLVTQPKTPEKNEGSESEPRKWLLFDWKAENKDDSYKCEFLPSTVPRRDEATSNVEEKDDLTLRMFEACRNKFLGKDEKAERPKYMGGEVFSHGGIGVDGPMMPGGGGQGRGGHGSGGMADKDYDLHQWAYHRWKQALEINVVAEIVWLYRALLQDVTCRKVDENKSLHGLNDKVKGAVSPNMMEPKFVVVQGQERDDPDKLGLVLGNLVPRDCEDTSDLAIKLSDESNFVEGMISIFEKMSQTLITDDNLEEEKQREEKKEEEGGAGHEGADDFFQKEEKKRPRFFSRPKPLNESDVLNHKELNKNNFDATLSLEETEHFHCLVTAPNLCIPIILSFFASDRVGLLLNENLRATFHRLIFEPGDITDELRPPDDAPFQKPQEKIKRTQKVEDQKLFGAYTEYWQKRQEFGTLFGRFAAELQGPQGGATLQSLVELGYGASSLATESYKAPGITLVLYFARTGCGVLHLGAGLGVASQHMNEYKNLQDWLFRICSVQLRTYIAKVEGDQELDAIEARKLNTNFHIHLVMLLESELMLGDVEKDSQQESDILRCLLLSVAYLSRSDPDYNVEVVMVRARPHLVRWADAHPLERNGLLGQVSSMALGSSYTSSVEKPMRCDKWEAAEVSVINCERTFDSTHPIPPGIKLFDKVHFAGSSHITITVDPLTELGDEDVMMFFKDAACQEPVGSQYSGSALSGSWPGVAGNEPLVVLTDCVYFQVTTTVESKAWGFKFRASAPVSEEGKRRMFQFALEEGIAEDLDGMVLELALKDMNNDVARAQKHLKHTCPQLAKRAEELKATASHGLFTDENGTIQVSIQTGEVFYNNKPPQPVPEDLFNTPDFKELFQHRPQSTVVESASFRKWYQISETAGDSDEQQTYMIRQWQKLEPKVVQKKANV
jgi:hypothetical protein